MPGGADAPPGGCSTETERQRQRRHRVRDLSRGDGVGGHYKVRWRPDGSVPHWQREDSTGASAQGAQRQDRAARDRWRGGSPWHPKSLFQLSIAGVVTARPLAHPIDIPFPCDCLCAGSPGGFRPGLFSKQRATSASYQRDTTNRGRRLVVMSDQCAAPPCRAAGNHRLYLRGQPCATSLASPTPTGQRAGGSNPRTAARRVAMERHPHPITPAQLSVVIDRGVVVRQPPR